MFDAAVLEEIARLGAAAALELFGRVSSEHKEDGSVVTEADRASQRVMRTRFRELESDPQRLFFLGEENVGVANGGRQDPMASEAIAAVDPVDGTTAFASGLPLWGVSIGLFHHGELVSGVVYMPLVGGADGSLYRGERGKPSTLNGSPVNVAPYRPWQRTSQIAVPSNVLRDNPLPGFPGKSRSVGSLAHHIALVAAGRLDAAYLGRPRVWDLAGGAAVLEGAGGALCNAKGAPVDWPRLLRGERPEYPLVAGSPEASSALTALMS